MSAAALHTIQTLAQIGAVILLTGLLLEVRAYMKATK